MYTDRYYAVVNTSQFMSAVSAGEILPDYLFPNILEQSFDFRFSLDRQYFILKTDFEQSAQYLKMKASELNIEYTEYEYDSILSLVSTSAWCIPPTRPDQPNI